MTYEEMIEDEIVIEGMNTKVMSDEEMDTIYIPDVEYMNLDGISRVLQILMPRKRNMDHEKYPLIIYVQGSAWHQQNVYQHVGQLNYLCKQGFVVAIVQYRESDIAPFPAQIEDTKTAIRFLKNIVKNIISIIKILFYLVILLVDMLLYLPDLHLI